MLKTFPLSLTILFAFCLNTPSAEASLREKRGSYRGLPQRTSSISSSGNTSPVEADDKKQRRHSAVGRKQKRGSIPFRRKSDMPKMPTTPSPDTMPQTRSSDDIRKAVKAAMKETPESSDVIWQKHKHLERLLQYREAAIFCEKANATLAIREYCEEFKAHEWYGLAYSQDKEIIERELAKDPPKPFPPPFDENEEK